MIWNFTAMYSTKLHRKSRILIMKSTLKNSTKPMVKKVLSLMNIQKTEKQTGSISLNTTEKIDAIRTKIEFWKTEKKFLRHFTISFGFSARKCRQSSQHRFGLWSFLKKSKKLLKKN